MADENHVGLVLTPALAAAADLGGVIDLHIHAAPDVMARSVDTLDAVRLARAAGLRAVVLTHCIGRTLPARRSRIGFGGSH
jgi:hypothetical protein